MGVCVLNYYGMAIYHYTGKVYQLYAGYKASHHTRPELIIQLYLPIIPKKISQ